MSDSDRLLQTLRTIAEFCRPFPISQIAKDAADEIERLRAATAPRSRARETALKQRAVSS